MFFHNITSIRRFLPRLKPGVSALLTYEREVRYRQRQDMRIAAKEVRRFYITAQNNLKFAESQRQRFRDMYGEDVPIDRMITIQIPVMPDDMYQR